jgi:dTDP-4-amino-4,6-dideoxygalactose transaminase
MQVPPFSLSQQISDLSADLERAVLSVLQSGQYIGGAQIQQFEAAFAASTGVYFAVGCNSGTDALILALRALGVGAGDEVITCSFSFFCNGRGDQCRWGHSRVCGCRPDHVSH